MLSTIISAINTDFSIKSYYCELKQRNIRSIFRIRGCKY